MRELTNILERAVILCDRGVLQGEHIGISIQQPAADVRISTLADERQHILNALQDAEV